MLGLSFTSAVFPATGSTKFDSNIDRATFVVVCGDKTGTVWQFSPGLYLTANHVVNHCNQPQIISSTGPRNSKTIFHNANYDIAELQSTFVAPSIVHISNAPIKIGDLVRVRSAPNGQLGTATGRIKRIELLNNIPVIEVSAHVSPGSSGGVMTNSSGNAIGLVQKLEPMLPELTIGIRQPFLSKFLSKKMPGGSNSPELSTLSIRAGNVLFVAVITPFIILLIALMVTNQRRKQQKTHSIQENQIVPLVLGNRLLEGD